MSVNSGNGDSRASNQPTKRRPGNDLNHDNWDQEEEPEEKGEFKKASEDQLKERKIITARRKQKPTTGETSNSPFGMLSFGTTTTNGNIGNIVAPAPVFNFNFGNSATTPKFDFSSIASISSGKAEDNPSITLNTTEAEKSEDNMMGQASTEKDKPTSSSMPAQPPTQCSKRRSEAALDDYDSDDEEPEEQGEFKKASEAELKERKIITARRNKTTATPHPPEQSSQVTSSETLKPSNNNPFGGLSFTSQNLSTQNVSSTSTATMPKFDCGSSSEPCSSVERKPNEPSSTSTPKSEESTLEEEGSESGVSDDGDAESVEDGEDNSATNT